MVTNLPQENHTVQLLRPLSDSDHRNILIARRSSLKLAAESLLNQRRAILTEIAEINKLLTPESESDAK